VEHNVRAAVEKRVPAPVIDIVVYRSSRGEPIRSRATAWPVRLKWCAGSRRDSSEQAVLSALRAIAAIRLSRLAGPQPVVQPRERAGMVERSGGLLAVIIGALSGGEAHVGLLAGKGIDQLRR